MYPKGRGSQTRSRFFTVLGQYMAPVPAAGGLPVNWINYKTGVKPVFFRIEMPEKGCEFGIEVFHNDPTIRVQYFRRLQTFHALFTAGAGAGWTWAEQFSSVEGQIVSRIYDRIENVSVFNENDWPALIAFLKQGLITLDAFWYLVKEQFDDLP